MLEMSSNIRFKEREREYLFMIQTTTIMERTV